MSILAYTLLAASGGAGGDGNFYAAFIGGTDYPKAGKINGFAIW